MFQNLSRPLWILHGGRVYKTHLLMTQLMLFSLLPSFVLWRKYHNGQTGLGKQCRPDQTVPISLIRVYTVCISLCIVWTHYSTVRSTCSNFRVITANFSGVQIFRIFTVTQFHVYLSTENTVQPVSKDHLWENGKSVFVHRWSLFSFVTK